MKEGWRGLLLCLLALCILAAGCTGINIQAKGADSYYGQEETYGHFDQLDFGDNQMVWRQAAGYTIAAVAALAAGTINPAAGALIGIAGVTATNYLAMPTKDPELEAERRYREKFASHMPQCPEFIKPGTIAASTSRWIGLGWDNRIFRLNPDGKWRKSEN